MDTGQERLRRMAQRLRETGHRITPQRYAVLRVLAESPRHPSAEQIHGRVKAEFPMVSLATVYKTLAVLKEVGEVLELGFPDQGNRYDGRRPLPHPHLVCTRCREILDPDVDMLAELERHLEARTGYRIVGHRLDFFGLCPRCQADQPSD